VCCAGYLLRIVLVITALLIYGSLYPWEFHAQRGPYGPIDTLIHTWTFSLNRFELRDIAVNIAIYMPFGAAVYLWLSSRPAILRFGGPLLLAAILSTSIEITQLYDARRYTSSVDIATNILGAALGMVLATMVAKRGTVAQLRIRHPGAALLLCCWLGALLFPLIPDLSRTDLVNKLAAFSSTRFAPVSFFALLVSWLAAARMLLALAGAEGGNTIFPLLGLVLPARFMVLGIQAGWEYWATFLFAWIFWMLFFAPLKQRDFLLALLIVSSVIATGLSPFHFNENAQSFIWVPFRSVFLTARETGFAIFLKKAFLFGSAVWLFREAGWPLRFAAMAMALILAAVEIAQRYLPNHVAEITDPLLCLLMAWLLHRLHRARAQAQ